MDFKSIGKQIRILRTQAGYSQEALAEAADLSPSYLSHIERGRKKISLKSLVQIADALGVTTDRLLSGNQSSDPSAFLPEVQKLLEAAPAKERRFLYETLRAIQQILHDNGFAA